MPRKRGTKRRHAAGVMGRLKWGCTRRSTAGRRENAFSCDAITRALALAVLEFLPFLDVVPKALAL